MKWVALLEMVWEVRQRVLVHRLDPWTATKEVTGVGVEVARAGNSVLVWLPSYNHIKPGAEEYTRGGGSLITTTSNLVRDATPEEIAKASGET